MIESPGVLVLARIVAAGVFLELFHDDVGDRVPRIVKANKQEQDARRPRSRTGR